MLFNYFYFRASSRLTFTVDFNLLFITFFTLVNLTTLHILKTVSFLFIYLFSFLQYFAIILLARFPVGFFFISFDFQNRVFREI